MERQIIYIEIEPVDLPEIRKSPVLGELSHTPELPQPSTVDVIGNERLKYS
jgi:hypothetical protein